MTTITTNAEKNGIEIRFDSKPSAETMAGLKENGFRWSGKQKMWYARQTAERIAFAESIRGTDVLSGLRNKDENKEHEEYDLWAMTRTEEIPHNYGLTRLHDNKEIAAIIRKHLRSRFPFCKWSVTSDYLSVDVRLKCSPWSKDSDEAQAIANYACRFTQSYNYDNSDPMTDYFDVNFYGTNTTSCVINHYDYEQREMTVSEMNMSARFAESKAAWEKSEAERQQREYEEHRRQYEIEREEAEKQRKIEEAKIAKIEAEAVVEDVSFAVVNCIDTGNYKCSSLKAYVEDSDRKDRRVVCKVSRTVTLDRENYENFCNLLLADFSFIDGMGGTNTDDLRIGSWTDYENMTAEERATVETFSVNCVAIYYENELKFVIDPQGYSYCRYVFLVDGMTAVATEYKGSSPISEESVKKYADFVDVCLVPADAEIIEENNLFTDQKFGVPNNDNAIYVDKMIEHLDSHNYPLSVKVVRAIKDEEFKVRMYRVLEKFNGMQHQFERAGLTYDQRFTMIKIDDWGLGVRTTHGKFREVVNTEYAQYKDAVKLVFRPENKRKDYYTYLHGNVLIIDGYVTVPEDLLFEVKVQDNSVVTKMSKYTSCDRRQLDDILEYFAKHGIRPIINTYKPEF